MSSLFPLTRRRFSLGAKLTAATLLPLVIAIIICSLIGFFILVARIRSQAQEKVRNDLNSAKVIYENEEKHVRDVVRFAAGAPFVAEALAAENRQDIADVLTPLMRDEKLQVFTAVDAAGNVVYRAQNPLHHGDDRSRDFIVRRALAGEITVGTTLFTSSSLLLESEELARQAKVKVVPTPRAKPATLPVMDSALCIIASAPVRDNSGRIVGALYGGIMLNNDNSLVDVIKTVVYEGVKLDGKDVGGATIFLDDVRIATNVSGSDGKRAIGTKLSEEVYNRVVLRKEKWVDRAFVVNDWYFSAYEPIVSLEGAPVGALYVGMLEKPYSLLKGKLSLLIGGVLMIGGITGVVVARLATARLARSMKELETVAGRLAAGERGVIIEMPDGDEIGNLAREFNRMSSALCRQEEEIRNLNLGLELKVMARTAELEEKNRLLLEAQQELLRVEKLAAVGELAAGVAHEINNPMAIIRGNADLIDLALPPDSPSHEEVGIINQQVGRVERIVTNLLRFARKERTDEVHKELVLVNRILEDIFSHLKYHVSLERIEVHKWYDPAVPEIECDPEHLGQVFTNLILNAVQAMPEGGRLTVTTGFNASERVVEVSVSDIGCGIRPEDLHEIFNPFFTTKSSGTGLGLSVSYGIIRNYGGNIVVESSLGAGSRFTVTLPPRYPVE